MHVAAAPGAARVAVRPNKTPPIHSAVQLHHSPYLHSSVHPSMVMAASAAESGEVTVSQPGQHEHLHPHGTEQLARIAVDYCPDACHHAPDSGEIHVTYDHRGGARWRSRRRFLPGGAVAAAIRAPAGDTAGLNYNLYLSSLEGSRNMDEIDFEFLGCDKRAVQTNFHVEGGGGREQIHELPFDSSDGFHHYAIAWSAEAIEWRIDGALIRRDERRAGEPWPEKPMFLYASVWDASDIDEGRWTGTYHGRDAPYLCSYRDVRVPLALSVEEEEEDCQDHADADAVDVAAAAVEEDEQVCQDQADADAVDVAAAAVEEDEQVCQDHADAAAAAASAAAVEEVDAGAGKD